MGRRGEEDYSHENLRGDLQCETHGEVVEGVLLEFLVEIRPMADSGVVAYLQNGQVPSQNRGTMGSGATPNLPTPHPPN
eukprot:5027249-Amphidinium_carterae.1